MLGIQRVNRFPSIIGTTLSHPVTITLSPEQRTNHTDIIGATGGGKSTLGKNLCITDIWNGEGVSFIDPHGSNAADILDSIPAHRHQDVYFLDPLAKNPATFNPLGIYVPPLKRATYATDTSLLFKPMFKDTWGSSRMQLYISMGIWLLLDNPVIATKDVYEPCSLKHLTRVYRDAGFRDRLLENVSDKTGEVLAFWRTYEKKKPKDQDEIASPIDHHIGQFILDPIIRDIITRPSTIKLRRIMDERKIFICSPSPAIGELNQYLLSGMLFNAIRYNAMTRDILRTKPVPHHCYVDELQVIATDTFASVLSEARKYGLHLTLMHQFLEQLDEEVRAAIIGNVGNLIVFRVGEQDAPTLARQLSQPSAPIQETSLIQLPNHQAYVRILQDGSPATFHIKTMMPIRTLGSFDAVLAMNKHHSLPR